jgi:hypothetical protein
VRFKSPSEFRSHIVRKPSHNAPKDIDITHCDLRVCGDCRRANDQLLKSLPTTFNGTDELQKIARFPILLGDRSLWNVQCLCPRNKPSRELLALHTPIGLIEPTRMVFGELNAGTVACAQTPSDIRTLPNNAHLLRTACYIDDTAQGSHKLDELLQGWDDFPALCLQKNWTLSAKKTRIGCDY